MMNYFEWIEPYLTGSLSPEEEELFERQLDRDPDLKEALARRFSGVCEDMKRPTICGFFESVPGKPRTNFQDRIRNRIIFPANN